jgi:hypothetical protein
MTEHLTGTTVCSEWRRGEEFKSSDPNKCNTSVKTVVKSQSSMVLQVADTCMCNDIMESLEMAA